FTAQGAKILVREERRLPDAFAIDEPEATMEGRRRRAGFLEQVAVGPVAHALHRTLHAFELAQDVRSADVRIVYRIARRVARAPPGEVERQIRKRRLRDLLPNAAHVTDDGSGLR